MNFRRYLSLIFILVCQIAWSNGVYQVNTPIRIGGEEGGAAVFPDVTVPHDGLYPMTVYYATSDDGAMDITVNHEIPRSLIFYRNARRNETSSQIVMVPLRAGVNLIKFENPRESGPELEKISVTDSPAESHFIAGMVKDENGRPVADLEVSLLGGLERRTVTDAMGRYEFRFLADGAYRVAPHKTGWNFSPHDYVFPTVVTNEGGKNFSGRPFPAAAKPVLVEAGHWRMLYDPATGAPPDILFDGRLLLGAVQAQAQLPQTVTSLDYQRRTVAQHRIKDGVELQIESANSDSDKMIQTFWFYDRADYFLTRLKIIKKDGAASNFMAPIVSDTPVKLFGKGDNRALFVPFDNDKWDRYNARPFGSTMTSYEVSAFYNNASRQGLIVGSIDHDTWKTGVRSTTSDGILDSLEVFGGITSSQTRDLLPHGKVAGTEIESPRIFVGLFSDWRAGLDAYARVNASVAPPRPWQGGVPFGWNSWGKMQFNVSYQKAIEVSDFFATELQPHHFEDNNIVYIGLDAGWNKFTDDQLKQFVAHCKKNHQEAGIYFTPFTDFGRHPEEKVEGSDYHYQDIYLYAHGQKQRIDGGLALDPTHPATKARIEYNINRFKKFGFKYLKADFMVQGTLEGDHFYDAKVTTGLQAYNEGMKFLNDVMGPDMYLNLAISPLFPSQYANSRRIACDAWGDIEKIEYTLSALTHGWWLGSVYDYLDPDHLVLDGYTDGENRARVTSAVLTGLFISGDDFSKDGPAAGKEKARRFLTNADIDALGRSRKTFRPVEGDTGNRAADLFVAEDAKYFYLAALNYSKTATNRVVSFDRIGLKTTGALRVKELWSGQSEIVSSPMTVTIPPADAVIYQFAKKKGL